MLELATFTYSLLAGFVLSSAGRNRRARRPNGSGLVLIGWVLMAMSFTLSALLFAWAGVLLLAG